MRRSSAWSLLDIYSLLDPPTAPGLTAVPGGNLSSVDFNIALSDPPNCVVNYIITATTGSDSRDITVPANSTILTVDGFNRCALSYSFSVLPETREGSGTTSNTVDIEAVDPGIFIYACSLFYQM